MLKKAAQACLAFFCRHSGQKFHFGHTQDLNASESKVFKKTGQRKAGAVNG